MLIHPGCAGAAAGQEAVWCIVFRQQIETLAHLGGFNHCRDAEAAGVLGNLGLRLGSAGSWRLPQRPSLTITNPPWGQRLMNGDPQVRFLFRQQFQTVLRLIIGGGQAPAHKMHLTENGCL